MGRPRIARRSRSADHTASPAGGGRAKAGPLRGAPASESEVATEYRARKVSASASSQAARLCVAQQGSGRKWAAHEPVQRRQLCRRLSPFGGGVATASQSALCAPRYCCCCCCLSCYVGRRSFCSAQFASIYPM